MAGTNDFVTFAGAGGANVISQAQYLALAAKSTGFQSGIAASNQLNKVWRQSSIMSAMIGQFIADNANANVVDDGTTAAIEAAFILAVQAINQVKLTANLNLYVNPSSGSDVNNGLTPSTAFRTIQAAFNAGYTGYNYNQHTLTVNLAPGTYTAGCQLGGMPVGCTLVSLLGSATNAAAYIISVTNGNGVIAGTGVVMSIVGVTISATGTSSAIVGVGYGVLANQAWVYAISCIMGTCTTAQLTAAFGATLSVQTCTFGGTSLYGLLAELAANLWVNNTTLTYSVGCTYTGATVVAASCGIISAVSLSIAGAANVAGTRFIVNTNGVIGTNGGGINYFPGNVAGGTTTGGQYS